MRYLYSKRNILMRHVKDNWVENDVFHASNLNQIAGAINELEDTVVEKADINHTHTPEEIGAMPADTVIINDASKSKKTTYSSDKIETLINSIESFDILVVNSLPTVGLEHTIYFVPNNTEEEKNVYDEYIYVSGNWEKIGSTRVDMSQYYTKGDVDGLLAGKSNTGHTHEISNITNLETVLAGKSDTGHTHSIGNISGLNTVLNGKQDIINDIENIRNGASLGATALQSVPSEYVTESELSSELAGKSDTGHTHTMSEVGGLTGALSGKADASHTHEMADVSGLTETLEEFSETVASHINEIEDTLEVKSDVGHTHEISDIDGLNESLESKSNTGHTHLITEIDDLSETLSEHEEALDTLYEHVTKAVRVDDVCWLSYSGHTPLSTYGLSSDDVVRFIDDKLTVNVNVGAITAAMSLVAPQIVDDLPSFIKKIVSNLFQLRFSTSNAATTVIEPVEQLTEIFTGGTAGAEGVTRILIYYGVTNTLKAIKYSLLTSFEQPRIALRMPAVVSRFITGDLDETLGIQHVAIDVVVTSNNIEFLGCCMDKAGSSTGSLIDSTIDSRFGLPAGTFKQMEASQVITMCYQISQDESVIETLPEEFRDIVRSWKGRIEEMATWNGYENVNDFVGGLEFLETITFNAAK